MDLEIITNFNLSGNFSLSDLNLDDSVSLLIHEILIYIVCLFGIIADALIIYIVLATKKLRSSVDIYVVNWAIVDLLYLAVTLCFYRMYAALENYLVTEELFCVAIELATIMQIASIIFITILCGLWFIRVFWGVHKTYTKYFITFVWSLAVILTTMFSMFCIHDVFYLASHFLTFSGYTLIIHLVVLIHCVKFYRKYKNIKPYDVAPFISTITSTYVVCCLPSWLCIMFLSFFKYVAVIAACVSYMNSAVNVFILYKYNKYFKMTFLKIFRCDMNGYNDAIDSTEVSETNDPIASTV